MIELQKNLNLSFTNIKILNFSFAYLINFRKFTNKCNNFLPNKKGFTLTKFDHKQIFKLIGGSKDINVKIKSSRIFKIIHYTSPTTLPEISVFGNFNSKIQGSNDG